MNKYSRHVKPWHQQSPDMFSLVHRHILVSELRLQKTLLIWDLKNYEGGGVGGSSSSSPIKLIY